MKRAQYYGEDKLFLTFSKESTLSYSTILQNIMIMLIHDDSDEFLTNSEALGAMNGLSEDDYDDLHARADVLCSDFDTQRYLENRGIYVGMKLNELNEDEIESFLNDISEIISWTEFEEYELSET